MPEKKTFSFSLSPSAIKWGETTSLCRLRSHKLPVDLFLFYSIILTNVRNDEEGRKTKEKKETFISIIIKKMSTSEESTENNDEESPLGP